MLSLSEKRIISKHVRDTYSSRDPKRVRFEADGSVTVSVDPMPNTNQAGRIFAGWDMDLLKDATK